MKTLEYLKKNLTESEDLSQVVHYFFDLMEQDNFFDLPSRKVTDLYKHEQLNFAFKEIKELASKRLGMPLDIVDYMLVEVLEKSFYHGSFILKNFHVPMLFLYCSDIQIGLVSLSTPDGHTQHFRFSLIKMETLNKIH